MYIYKNLKSQGASLPGWISANKYSLALSRLARYFDNMNYMPMVILHLLLQPICCIFEQLYIRINIINCNAIFIFVQTRWGSRIELQFFVATMKVVRSRKFMASTTNVFESTAMQMSGSTSQISLIIFLSLPWLMARFVIYYPRYLYFWIVDAITSIRQLDDINMWKHEML